MAFPTPKPFSITIYLKASCLFVQYLHNYFVPYQTRIKPL